MPSTYSTSLRIELQADGENASTWGQKANNDFNLFEAAIAGRAAVNIAGAVDFTLTAVNGAADQSRNSWIELTGLMTASFNVIVPTVSKWMLIYNNTTGAFVPTVKTAAGSGIAVAQGSRRLLFCDGTNVVDALSSYVSSTIPMTLTSTLAGAGPEVALRLLRNKGAGVANDSLEEIAFSGESSTSVLRDYAGIGTQIVSPTNGAESGYLFFRAASAGANAPRLYLGLGLFTVGASGGDKGANTINATTLYEGGNTLASTYAGLAAANTFSAVPQTINNAGAVTFLALASSAAGSATGGPTLDLNRNSNQAAGNLGPVINFFSKDAGGNVVTQAIFFTETTLATAGSSNHRLRIRTTQAGAANDRLFIGAGLYTPSATGGDKGAESLNLNGPIYINGKAGLTGVAPNLTDAATIVWDAGASPTAAVTLNVAGATRALGAPSNTQAGMTYILRILQDGSGNRALTYNAVFKFTGGTPPVLSTAAGAQDFLYCYCYDGTNIHANLSKGVS